jgi:hypothetical protein
MPYSEHPHPLKRFISVFLMVVIIPGAIYSGFLFFSTIRAAVARTTLPFMDSSVQAGTLPIIPLHSSSAAESDDSIVELQERVNILLLGID